MRSERAQALIEFALITPVLIILMLVIIDFGISLDRKIIVTNAVREAARYASLGNDTNPTSIATVAVDQAQGGTGFLPGQGITPSDVSVYWVDQNGDGRATAGEPVVVHLDLDYQLPIANGILGVFGGAGPALNLGACADMALVQDVSGVTVSAPSAVPCGGT